jgi:hypothetical protein
MSEHANYHYVVTAPMPIVTRPAPVIENPLDKVLYCGENEVTLDHIFDSVLVAVEGVASIPAGYERVVILNDAAVEILVDGKVKTRYISIYAYPNHLFNSAYEAVVGDRLHNICLRAHSQGGFLVQVPGVVHSYTAGVLPATAKNLFVSHVNEAIKKLVTHNLHVLSKLSDVALLTG